MFCKLPAHVTESLNGDTFDGDILGLPALCALYLLDVFIKCYICHRLPVTLTLNRGCCCYIQRDILMGAGE